MDTLSTEWDTGDLDALEELKRDRGYQLVRDRIELAIERARCELESKNLDYPKTCDLRGYIHGLRLVLDIPLILRSEITGLIPNDKR